MLKNGRPTWCHLVFYFTSYVLNMFRTLIYPSSGACNTLMMDILMSETCWAHKWNKIASDFKLVFHSSTITMMHGPISIRLCVCIYIFDNHRVMYRSSVLWSVLQQQLWQQTCNSVLEQCFSQYLWMYVFL